MWFMFLKQKQDKGQTLPFEFINTGTTNSILVIKINLQWSSDSDCTLFSGSSYDEEACGHRGRRAGQLVWARWWGRTACRQDRRRRWTPLRGRWGRERSCKANQGMCGINVIGPWRDGGRRQHFPLCPVRVLHGRRGRVSAAHPAAQSGHGVLPVPAVWRVLRFGRLFGQTPLHHTPSAGHPQRWRTQRPSSPWHSRRLARCVPSGVSGGRGRKPDL